MTSRHQETPVGQSAVSAGQAAPIPDPTAPETAPQSGAPVEGATPVGETAHSAPPVQFDAAAAAKQRKQNVGNLAVLARQAIAMGNETMTVNPKIVADFCTAYDEMSQTSEGSVAVPEGALEHAKEEGRREAIAEFAEEKAEMHQRIADLEGKLGLDTQSASPETETPSATSNEGDDFKGPGQ